MAGTCCGRRAARVAIEGIGEGIDDLRESIESPSGAAGLQQDPNCACDPCMCPSDDVPCNARYLGDDLSDQGLQQALDRLVRHARQIQAAQSDACDCADRPPRPRIEELETPGRPIPTPIHTPTPVVPQEREPFVFSLSRFPLRYATLFTSIISPTRGAFSLRLRLFESVRTKQAQIPGSDAIFAMFLENVGVLSSIIGTSTGGPYYGQISLPMWLERWQPLHTKLTRVMMRLQSYPATHLLSFASPEKCVKKRAQLSSKASGSPTQEIEEEQMTGYIMVYWLPRPFSPTNQPQFEDKSDTLNST